jgi:hypothetical protein
MAMRRYAIVDLSFFSGCRPTVISHNRTSGESARFHFAELYVHWILFEHAALREQIVFRG